MQDQVFLPMANRIKSLFDGTWKYVPRAVTWSLRPLGDGVQEIAADHLQQMVVVMVPLQLVCRAVGIANYFT